MKKSWIYIISLRNGFSIGLFWVQNQPLSAMNALTNLPIVLDVNLTVNIEANPESSN